MMRRQCAVFVAGVLMLTLAGCATSNPPAPQPGAGTFHRDPDLQWVWVADGFSFRGYGALHIEEPIAQVAKLDPDGVENLAWARGVLRDEMAAALRAKSTFHTVTTGQVPSAPAPGKTLRLQTTILEYEKGGGGARFWAGRFGAGQPVIRVQGRVMDGNLSRRDKAAKRVSPADLVASGATRRSRKRTSRISRNAS
jgi:hypothetical protein